MQRPVHQPVRDRGVRGRGGGAARRARAASPASRRSGGRRGERREAHGRVTPARGPRAAERRALPLAPD